MALEDEINVKIKENRKRYYLKGISNDELIELNGELNGLKWVLQLLKEKECNP